MTRNALQCGPDRVDQTARPLAASVVIFSGSSPAPPPPLLRIFPDDSSRAASVQQLADKLTRLWLEQVAQQGQASRQLRSKQRTARDGEARVIAGLQIRLLDASQRWRRKLQEQYQVDTAAIAAQLKNPQEQLQETQTQAGQLKARAGEAERAARDLERRLAGVEHLRSPLTEGP